MALAKMDDGNFYSTREGQERTIRTAIAEMEDSARAITIRNEAEYKAAGEFGRAIKRREAEVKDFWKPMKDAAHKAHAEICAREKAMLEPLSVAEREVKRVMAAYAADIERKRKELEAAMRRAAQEEVDKKLAQAATLEAGGDAAAAAAAMTQAEIADAAAGTVAIAGAKVKADGVASKTDYEITACNPYIVPVFFGDKVIRPVDMAAVMKIIRESKGTAKIPGIEYKAVKQISFRK